MGVKLKVFFILLAIAAGCAGNGDARDMGGTAPEPASPLPTYELEGGPAVTPAPTSPLETAPPSGIGEAAELPENPPDLEGLVWVNSQGYALDDLKGNVVMIEFWNRFCTRCQRLNPRMLEYNNKYSARGLVILALHVPAVPEDKDPDFFLGVLDEMGIEHPVALDNDYRNWFNYGVEYTGTVFLIDRKGRMRYRVGIGEYDTLEDKIKELL